MDGTDSCGRPPRCHVHGGPSPIFGTAPRDFSLVFVTHCRDYPLCKRSSQIRSTTIASRHLTHQVISAASSSACVVTSARCMLSSGRNRENAVPLLPGRVVLQICKFPRRRSTS